MTNILAFFEPIRAFIFDIDGVLTDGQLLLHEDGSMLRRMNIKDGYALQLAVKKGYEVCVISGGKSTAAKVRLERLGLREVHIDVTDKSDLLSRLTARYGWRPEQILYMGDDMPDRKAMEMCGLPAAPNDAAAEIKAIARYISPYGGGKGCVRDVIEKVLKLQGHWE